MECCCSPSLYMKGCSHVTLALVDNANDDDT